jgi:hypothetical protein
VERFGAEVLNDYHVHFSYGANIGKPGCTIPTMGIDWLAAVPPVVMELWAGAPQAEDVPADGPFTTVGNWGAYGGVTWNGEHYGQKDEEFLRLIDLPRNTSRRLELALSGAEPDVRERLRSHGWSVRDAGEEVSTDVETYRAYIIRSRGELSVAKNAYVKTRSGWFSDRSACYLAAGRPAILQDTGFTDWLVTSGRGILPFSTAGEAADCLARVDAAYVNHSSAARDVARRVFSHEVVLPRLLGWAQSSSYSIQGYSPHTVLGRGGVP